MNNISGDKMFAHLDRVIGDNRPITADVFLTNYCNNNCPYCTYKRWEFDTGATSMSLDDFVRYALRLQKLGVLGIILTGGGEPTIAKDFDKIVDWLELNHFNYGINTNFNKLVYFRPNYLKVSLDAWDRESYINARGVDAYDTVRTNIQEYIKWKKEHSPNTTVGIQMLAKNVGDVFKFYEANKDLEVDYIAIRPMESTDGSYYKNLIVSDAYLDMLPDNIVKSINQLSSLDSRVINSYKWNFINHRESYCVANWSQIALNELGEVMYCCHKPYQIVGHILDDDILEKKKDAVTNMSMCDIPCRLSGPNYEINKIISPKSDVNFI